MHVSVLSATSEPQLAEGADGAVVGRLFLRQLHVAWPQHHRYVQARLLSSLCLCKQHTQQKQSFNETIN